MSICGCGRRIGLLVCHRSPFRSLAIARSLFLGGLRLVPSSGCGLLLRFLRDFIIVSVAVSSRIRYRMIRCG